MTGAVEMEESEYHRHPALSQSGAKLLLPPNCPAIYRYRMDHPEFKDVFDFGQAAHKMVLGKGAPIRVIDAKDWRTNAAKAEKAAAHEAGEIPLLVADYATVCAMAKALRENPLAAKLLDAGRGRPEASLFWEDPDTGCPMRCRVDWLPDPGSDPFIVVDYKSTASADPETFGVSAARYGYHTQDANYRDAVKALGLHDDPHFLFIAQEKEPPYLVSVIELTEDAIDAGRARMRRAIDIYLQCMETDHWPNYTDDEIALVDLPHWAYREAAV